MPLRVLAVVATVAAVLAASSHFALAGTGGRVGLVRHDGTSVHRSPSAGSPVIASLVEQTQVEVLGKKHGWSHVRIWASVKGWMRSSSIVFRHPWPSTSTYHAPQVKYPVRPRGPYALRVAAVTTDTLRLADKPGGTLRGSIRAGSGVTVSAWRQDAKGSIWYRIGSFWAPGAQVQFRLSDPSTAADHGIPLWRSVAGKGMWVTIGTMDESQARALVHGAKQNGITHLYVEAAISPLGFHGRDSVAPLLTEAHRHHIGVVAWVYPYLYDVAADVRLTQRVASYRTAGGDGFDGIASDLERNFTLANVRAYSQLVRRYLGPDYLLVGVTYPPQSVPDYPFAEIGHDYNVLAPMDYWHQTSTGRGLDYGHMRYGYGYGYRYAVDSITAVRRAGSHIPVAPIGQTFDDFGRLEMGPHAPSQAEVSGFLRGSKDSRAIGVSFFQWMTATDPEWRAIRAFRF